LISSTPGRSSAVNAGSARRSLMTTSALCSACQPRSVIRSVEPGPAPTRVTWPGAVSGAGGTRVAADGRLVRRRVAPPAGRAAMAACTNLSAACGRPAQCRCR
jgi:hypothetical protein